MIEDKVKLLAYLKQLKWQEAIIIKRQLVETLPCSLTKIASLIGEVKSATSSHVKLARAVEQHPELSKCRNITAACSRMKQIENGATPSGEKVKFDFEADLQRYLYENWEKTQFSKDWELISSISGMLGRYTTSDVGEIDLLARGRTSPDRLVIELKRDQSSDETVGQLLRYMGWVKSHLANGDEKVHGLIISATVDAALDYAIACVPNVKVLVYERNDNSVVFSSPEHANITTAFAQMSPEDKQKMIEELRNMNGLD